MNTSRDNWLQLLTAVLLKGKTNKKQSYSLRVLTYHRVTDIKESPFLDPSLISATPATFTQQMQYLMGKYNVISMTDVLNAVKNNSGLPRRAVLITFDDAYHDFIEFAWPVLKRFQLPATIFVPTAYPDKTDQSFWNDRLYSVLFHTSKTEISIMPIGTLQLGTCEERRQSLEKLKSYLKTIDHTKAMALVNEICFKLDEIHIYQKTTLSWEELRQLASKGVTIGAHTRTHPILPKLSYEDIRTEIIGSQSDLQKNIGTIYPIFCYPNGGYDDNVVNILKEEGFILAFSTMDGHNDLRYTNHLLLRRTNITTRTSLLIFKLRLLKLGTYIDAWRHWGKE
jgi:peptidoglycan/xylan/chitin deacetylase (PgdA/CDA1 family)